MKFLFCALSALVFVLSVSAYPFKPKEIPPQCGDPTFACQDLQSARSCGVVKTCIHDIWATMRAPDGDNDQVCDICKEMVKEARDQLLSNMTQEEIKEVFEGSCKLLPVKFIANACIKVVDEIIPELVEMLASRMDPTMVCTVSGMCFPSGDKNSLEYHILKHFKLLLIKPKESECEQCTTMVADVQKFLNHTSESDAKTYIETICKQKIPSYLCNLAMKEYFDDIYKLVVSSAPLQLCSSAGVCPHTSKISIRPHIGDELTCEFCEHLIQHMKDLITTNTTMEEFRTALLNFCKQTGKFSSKCTALVNDYYDMLFTYIKELDTKGACTLMGLCNDDGPAHIPLIKLIPAKEPGWKIPLIKLQPVQAPETNEIRYSPLVKLVPAEEITKKHTKESNDIENLQLPIERINPPNPILTADTECAMCRAFSIYLEKDLNGDFSKDAVKKAIDGLCDKWMQEYPDYCHTIVNHYSFKIQKAIAKGVSFEDLCSSLRVCHVTEERKGLNLKVISNAKETPFCELCKDAMTEVENQLNDPATKQKLKDLLDQGCNVLPKSLRDDCVNFVNTNVDALLDILQQELKPDNVCPALGLCSPALRIAVSARVKDLECDVCKDVVTSFRQRLQDPASKEIVQTFLEEGCIRLPQSIAAECKQFVDENIDTLMTMIIDEMDPQKVCAILNICQDSVKIEKTEKLRDIECDLCKQVVAKVIDMVKDQKTEEEIKKALDGACTYLPSSMAAKCEKFVNEYTDLLVQLIAQELTPDMVCAELNICPNSVKIEKEEKIKDIECDLCKQVVAKVIDMVKDQKTEEEIKKALDGACTYLPSSMAAKCEKFVNEYTDLLVQLIAQELTPDMVCAELNICPNTVKVGKVKDDQCGICQGVVVGVYVTIWDHKTAEDINNALDRVCKNFPSSMTSECETFVQQYRAQLVQMMLDEMNPDQICLSLGVCPGSLKIEKVKDLECDLCKQVVVQVIDMVEDQKTEDEIKNALDDVCSYLPSSIATKCENFVNEYTDLLVQLILQELDPDMVCHALNVCNGKKEMPTKVKDLECELCKEVVSKVEDMVKDKKTEEEIRNALDHVCSILPKRFAAKCEKFVNQYADLIISLLTQELDPDMVCAALKACPEQKQFAEWQSKAQDLECKGCQYALHFIQEKLMNAETQAELKILLEKVCRILPGAFAANCRGFVDEYGSAVLVLVAQEIDPSVLCNQFKMCTNQTRLFEQASSVLESFHMDECSVCVTVVDYLDKLLEEDDVDREITQLIEKVCTVVPSSFRGKCSTIMEAYGPYILQMIGQLADSKQVCQDIDLCPRTPGHAHLIGGSKCTFGPSYWCKSATHAAACKADSYCKEKVWAK